MAAVVAVIAVPARRAAVGVPAAVTLPPAGAAAVSVQGAAAVAAAAVVAGGAGLAKLGTRFPVNQFPAVVDQNKLF